MSEPGKLNLRIICLTGIKYDAFVHTVMINLNDGLMQVNKNYGSVIEQVKKGRIKIYLTSDKADPVFFDIAEGWLVNKKNVCNIYVSEATQI